MLSICELGPSKVLPLEMPISQCLVSRDWYPLVAGLPADKRSTRGQPAVELYMCALDGWAT